MSTRFLRISAEMTVAEAVTALRSSEQAEETIHTVYVTDRVGRLVGTVRLQDLLFSSSSDQIQAIMDTATVHAWITDDRERAAAMISQYDLLALPVTTPDGQLLGIVTVDDAMDILCEEATEDIEKMAAITPTDLPYLKTGVITTWRKRIPWLLFLTVTATFTGAIISHYEHALGQMVTLTAFIPMLMDTGGNAGGQTSATVIRGLSLGEIRMRNIPAVLWKEFRVALLCGITLAALTFFKISWIDRAPPTVALVVVMTLFFAVILAKLVGSLLPILAKGIGLDPAVMASPFITTVVDAAALLIYFGIARLILNI